MRKRTWVDSLQIPGRMPSRWRASRFLTPSPSRGSDQAAVRRMTEYRKLDRARMKSSVCRTGSSTRSRGWYSSQNLRASVGESQRRYLRRKTGCRRRSHIVISRRLSSCETTPSVSGSQSGRTSSRSRSTRWYKIWSSAFIWPSLPDASEKSACMPSDTSARPTPGSSSSFSAGARKSWSRSVGEYDRSDGPGRLNVGLGEGGRRESGCGADGCSEGGADDDSLGLADVVAEVVERAGRQRSATGRNGLVIPVRRLRLERHRLAVRRDAAAARVRRRPCDGAGWGRRVRA